jgi:rubredoxin
MVKLRMCNNSPESREKIMKSWQCTICQYVYDPAVGDMDHGIAPGTAFEELPEEWLCPVCGAGKSLFEQL